MTFVVCAWLQYEEDSFRCVIKDPDSVRTFASKNIFATTNDNDEEKFYLILLSCDTSLVLFSVIIMIFLQLIFTDLEGEEYLKLPASSIFLGMADYLLTLF